MKSYSRRKHGKLAPTSTDKLLGPYSVEDIAELIRQGENAEEEESWDRARDIWIRLSTLIDQPGRSGKFQRKAARAQERLTYDSDAPTIEQLRHCLSIWLEAYALESDDAYTLYSIGYAETEIGDLLAGAEATAAYERALPWFERSLELDSDDAETHHMLAWTCKTLGLKSKEGGDLLEVACRHYARACVLDPDRAHSMEGWSDALRGLAKRCEAGARKAYLYKAIRVLRRALRHEPERASTWHKLGTLQRDLALLRSEKERARHLASALGNYRKAVACDDSRRTSHYYIGLCCYDLARMAKTPRSMRHWYARALAAAHMVRNRYPDYDSGLWLEVVATIDYHRNVKSLPEYTTWLRRMAEAAQARATAGSSSTALYQVFGELSYQFVYEERAPEVRWHAYQRYSRMLRRWLHTASDTNSVPELLARLNANCQARFGPRRARLHNTELIAFIHSQVDQGEDPAIALRRITDRALDTAGELRKPPARRIMLDGLERAFDELARCGAEYVAAQNAHGRVLLRLADQASDDAKLNYLRSALACFEEFAAHDPSADYAFSNQALTMARIARHLPADDAEIMLEQAAALYERALSIRSDNRNTRANYADFLLQRAQRAVDIETDHRFSNQALTLLTELRRDNDKLGAYNLACAYARLGRTSEALAALRRAKELGALTDLDWARRDPDLAHLHHLPEFDELMC